MVLKDLARKLPRPIEQAARYLYGAIPLEYRLGRGFRDMRAFLRESGSWPKERLETHQMQQLSILLQNAYDNVPYYRRVFDDKQMKPRDVEGFSDLTKLPFLTRELIKNNLGSLVSMRFPKRKLRPQSTGGSTGEALGYYEPPNAPALEDAFMLDQWERVGAAPNSRVAMLRGAMAGSTRKRTYWDYNPVRKQLILSAYHISEDSCRQYVTEMERRGIEFLHGHPSSIAVLANLMVRHRIQYPLKAVLGASEAVYAFERELVEQAFECRLFSWYGQSEKVVLAGECEQSNRYHCFPQYGITEIVDEEGQQITVPGRVGEIVGTGFINDAMPFIRYRTGDMASWAGEPCPCGRSYPLVGEVVGRIYEYIYTSDGRAISLTGLIFGQHFRAFSRIKKMQLFQAEKGRVEIRIVRYPDFADGDEHEIAQVIQRCVGSGLAVTFRYLDDIAPTKRGKHKFLIQELPVHLGPHRNNG